MCRHEDKQCPRCGNIFECKAGNITQCQCYGIHLTDEEQHFIGQQFSGCLCIHCITGLRTAFNTAKFTAQIRKHPGH